MINPPHSTVVSVSEMRAAEAIVIAGGVGADALMLRAAKAICEHVQLLAPNGDILVLCGPGNNGGDGYAAARLLAGAGRDVRVAALGTPSSPAALAAHGQWAGSVVPLADATSADVVVDALFGVGLSRPLAPDVSAQLAKLVASARFSLAVDVPSGVDADNGALLGGAQVSVTLAIAATKPAHFLMPAAELCGTVYQADIGVLANGQVGLIGAPHFAAPTAAAHKYSRGMVGIVGGTMAGAALLAAQAALRIAGYVAVTGVPVGGPDALVRKEWAELAREERLGALLIGPGLGRGDDSRRSLKAALESVHPLVLDGDALTLIAGTASADFRRHHAPVIVTPHEGEFAALFPAQFGTKFERARGAAALSGATVVYKGSDTVIATPDGRVATLPPASPWLATAGTGDVLAGMVAAFMATGLAPFAAASAAVWLHRECAALAGVALIADDLPPLIPSVIAARL